jgi:dihydrolipoamide dehydrogenase
MSGTKIAVIGGGPGGYVAAIRAAQLGAEVTLIEENKLGGTCLNEGCSPTKALLHSAHLLGEIRNGAEYGITATPILNFAQVQKRKEKIVTQLVKGVSGLMKANKIAVVQGRASFKDAKTLQVKGQTDSTLAFDKIIIATGSRPVKLPIPGIDSPQCVNSTGALNFETVPKSMLIIGGGVIGVELATVYSAFGTKITIVEMEQEILPLLDSELAGILRKALCKRNIEILVSAKLKSIEDKGTLAKVNVDLDGKNLAFEAEKVLVSVGRRANTDTLGLDSVEIKHDRGRITVDDTMRTSVPGVYAIGDCLGRTMLAHVASVQGEIAAENALGGETSYDEKTNPSCVYTDPEFASVGLTEKEAQKRGVKYVVGRFPLAANGKALIVGGGAGVVKILADPKYDEIIGLHILGPRATDMIGEGAFAIGIESTLDEMEKIVHAHPTISEAIREAALAAKKRAIHMPN